MEKALYIFLIEKQQQFLKVRVTDRCLSLLTLADANKYESLCGCLGV